MQELSKEEVKSIVFSKGLNIRDGVLYGIGACEDTHIVIPDSVKRIDEYAFDGCKSLKSIVIGNGVENIGRCAFYECSSLENITIPDNVKSIDRYAFDKCLSLKSIVIGNGITNLDLYGLHESSLEEVILGENLQKIRLSLPNTVKFFEEDGLNYLGSNSNKYLLLYKANSKIEKANVNNKCKFIYSSAFYGCVDLKYLTIGESVKSIGFHAFQYCTSLGKVYFNAIECDDLETIDEVFSMAGNDSGGFEVVFGEKVTKIPENLFGCNSSREKPKIINVKKSEQLIKIEKLKEAQLKEQKEKKEAEEERKRAQEAERERIRKEQQRIEAEKKRKIRLGVSLGLLIVIIASIFIGIVLNNKKKEEEARIDELRYGCSHISMTIDSKTNGEQSYNYYITNLKITIKNDCQRDIRYLDCNLLINSVDSNVQLWKGDVTLNGNVSSYGGNSSWNLELKSTSNELWNYPLEGLKIQCKWTSARFDEPSSYTTSKTYDDSYKVIYSGNVNYKSNMYQQAKNYYNQGKYQDAYDIFEQLGSYLDSASWVEKCVEKIAEQNRLESVNQFKQYLSYIDNNIPVPSKVEYWGTAGIGTTHYEGSDRNCVYGQGYIYNMVNGLTFISDYESELITAGYTKVTGGSYYNTCDYYYEKGGVIIGFNNLVNNYYDYYFYMVAFKVN